MDKDVARYKHNLTMVARYCTHGQIDNELQNYFYFLQERQIELMWSCPHYER